MTILFVSSMPNDFFLKLEEEFNLIKNELDDSFHKNDFNLIGVHNVSSSQLMKLILVNHPTILHYSGGGTARGLPFHDAHGRSEIVPSNVISKLFKILLKENVQLVVLNSCYSDDLAGKLTQYVSCAIGMSGFILDDAALAFAKNFYMTLFSGKSIQDAFDLSCLQLDADKSTCAEMPKLFVKKGIVPSELFPLNNTKNNHLDLNKNDLSYYTNLLDDSYNKFKTFFTKLMNNQLNLGEFYEEINPIISNIVVDHKLIGQNEILPLNLLWIDLNGKILRYEKEGNIGNDDECSKWENESKSVAYNILNFLKTTRYLIK
jgi:hypothetical protein